MIEKEILNLLLEIRKNGLSQSQLVKKAGLVSEPRLSRILRGHVWPTNQEIQKLCAALNVQPEYLDFNLEEEK